MRMANITWLNGIGEGKVRFSKDFDDMPWIVKLDCLRDALYEIEEMYNSLLESDEILQEAKQLNKGE